MVIFFYVFDRYVTTSCGVQMKLIQGFEKNSCTYHLSIVNISTPQIQNNAYILNL